MATVRDLKRWLDGHADDEIIAYDVMTVSDISHYIYPVLNARECEALLIKASSMMTFESSLSRQFLLSLIPGIRHAYNGDPARREESISLGAVTDVPPHSSWYSMGERVRSEYLIHPDWSGEVAARYHVDVEPVSPPSSPPTTPEFPEEDHPL